MNAFTPIRHTSKRNKDRLACVTNGAADALADWLTIRGSEPGALFPPIRRGGHVKAGRLTTQAIYYILTLRDYSILPIIKSHGVCAPGAMAKPRGRRTDKSSTAYPTADRQ